MSISLPYLQSADIGTIEQLQAIHGSDAAREAASQAEYCRDRGNYLNYCRWRQIERMLLVLTLDETIGTVH